MEQTQDLKLRKRTGSAGDEAEPEPELKTDNLKDHQSTTSRTKPAVRESSSRRMAMARRGIRSLAIAVSIPFLLTLLSIHVSTTQQHSSSPSSSSSYYYNTKTASTISSKAPFWFPPLWALHVSTVASTLLMGLSAWLVWAEGGFHKDPAMLVLYLVQLGLSLVWDPLVLGLGMGWLGVVLCLGMFGSLVGCSRQFREVNPIAGDLVKLCLAWVAFLALFSLRLAFLSTSLSHHHCVTAI